MTSSLGKACSLVLALSPMACTGPQAGTAPSSVALTTLSVSFADYYADYVTNWQQHQADIEANYQMLRAKTFDELYTSLKPSSTRIEIGSYSIEPKAGDLAQAETILHGLGETFPTLGAFFDNYGIKPRQLSEQELGEGLKNLAGATPSLGLVDPVTAPNPTDGSIKKIQDCQEWYNAIPADATVPSPSGGTFSIQAGLLDSSNYQDGSGTDNGDYPTKGYQAIKQSNAFVTNAKSALKKSPKTATATFYSFYRFLSDPDCKDIILAMQRSAAAAQQPIGGQNADGIATLGQPRPFNPTFNGASSSSSSSAGASSSSGGGADGEF